MTPATPSTARFEGVKGRKKKEKKKMYKNSQMNEDLVKKKKTEANRK